MSETFPIAAESILAAVIDSTEAGYIVVTHESFVKDRAGLSIALDYDLQTDSITLTLVESEDIEFEDE